MKALVYSSYMLLFVYIERISHAFSTEQATLQLQCQLPSVLLITCNPATTGCGRFHVDPCHH